MWHSGQFPFVLWAGCHGILFWFRQALGFFFSFLTLYKSCDILVRVEKIIDGWMDGWLLFVFLSLVDLLFLHFPSLSPPPPICLVLFNWHSPCMKSPASLLTCLRHFVNVSVTLLTLKGVPERFCPTFGASAVLWGQHLFSKRLREHRPSHFCPVQQGKY